MSFKDKIMLCQQVFFLSLKTSLRVVCVTAFFSFILFFWKDLDFVQYLCVALPVLFFFIASYCFFRSKKFFSLYGLIALANLAVFLFQKYREGYWIFYDVEDKIYLLYAFCILAFLLG